MTTTALKSTIQVPDRIRDNGTVGAGLCSLVYRLDAVAKCYNTNQKKEKAAEIAVYERLASAPTWNEGILRYYGTLDDKSIILQYAQHGPIRQYLSENPRRIGLSTKLSWAQQATEAIAFLHSQNILHCDISCNNIFITADLKALFGDFSGSSLDGKQCLTWYEASHSHPDMEEPTVKSEIFALGSTFYEMLAERKLFDGLDEDAIEDAIQSGQFPSLKSLPALQAPISKCWNQEYESIDDLLQDIKEEALTVRSRPAYSSILAVGLAALVPLAWWIRTSKILTRD